MRCFLFHHLDKTLTLARSCFYGKTRILILKVYDRYLRYVSNMLFRNTTLYPLSRTTKCCMGHGCMQIFFSKVWIVFLMYAQLFSTCVGLIFQEMQNNCKGVPKSFPSIGIFPNCAKIFIGVRTFSFKRCFSTRLLVEGDCCKCLM